MRVQGQNKTITSFVEDVFRLSSRAEPQAMENKKLRFHMRGVRGDIVLGLVRNPPTTVEAFVTKATTIVRALQARVFYYQRHPGVAASVVFSGEVTPVTPDILEIIQEVVLEKLRRLLPASSRPTTFSIAEFVREEAQRVV